MINRNAIVRDANENRSEVGVDKLEFRPSVYGVIIKDDKILLARTRDGWDFPGGGIEVWETIDEALEREVREETGVEVRRGALLHVQDDFFSRDGRYEQCLLILYKCEYVSGTPSADHLTEEEKEYMGAPEWLPLDSIESLKFYNPFDSVAIIKQALTV